MTRHAPGVPPGYGRWHACTRRSDATREASAVGARDPQPITREGQIGPFEVAERPVRTRNPGNAGGAKGPRFKPGRRCPWALRVLSLPATAPEVSTKLGRRHRTTAERAQHVVAWLRRWLRTIGLTVVGDSAYSVIELGLSCRRRSVRLIAPLRFDARLFPPAPPKTPGKVGRPRVAVADRDRGVGPAGMLGVSGYSDIPSRPLLRGTPQVAARSPAQCGVLSPLTRTKSSYGASCRSGRRWAVVRRPCRCARPPRRPGPR